MKKQTSTFFPLRRHNSRLLLALAMCILSSLKADASPGGVVTISSAPPSATCAGSSFTVNYTASGFHGGNVFTLELSNSSGSFASPDTIGSVSSNNDGSITATIDASQAYGTGYRMRIISSDPEETSSTSTSFTIDTAIAPLSAISGPGNVCMGSTITLSNEVIGGSWNSSNVSIATVSSNGIVTPVSDGGVVISYTASNSCNSVTRTRNITVDPITDPGAISGNSSMCVDDHGTVNLSKTVNGGTWTSSNTSVATVASNGHVSAVAVGTAVISYAITDGCGTAYATHQFTVNPYISHTTGAAAICAGSTTTLSNASLGGTWSSLDMTVATVGTAGDVSALAYGNARIVYETPDLGCGIALDTFTIHADTALDLNISGIADQCVNLSHTLTANYNGGNWTSSNSSVASINSAGLVNSLAAGTTNISYSLSNACGTFHATVVNTVYALPSVTIAPLTICERGEGNISIVTATPGGVFSGTASTYTTDASTGHVIGITASTGIVTYTYTDANTCVNSDTALVRVNAVPVLTTLPALNSTICNSAFGPIKFNSSISGTTFNWTTNSNSVFGSNSHYYDGGTSDSIAAFTATNLDSATVNSTVVTIISIAPTGCRDTTNDTVKVYPTPKANNVSDIVVCNNTTINTIHFSGPYTGTSYAWAFDGSSAPVGFAGTSGVDSIATFLTAIPGPDTSLARITITPKIGTCPAGASKNLKIIVRPTPSLSGSLSHAVCDNTPFHFTAASLSHDSSFSWTRPVVSHITAVAGSGINGIDEVLHNDTTYPIIVTYTYNLTARGLCSNTQNVTLTVNPTPRLDTAGRTPSPVCDRAVFHFDTASLTAGATYKWKRLSDVDNTVDSGYTSINHVLHNDSLNSRMVTYKFVVTANGCSDSSVSVAVRVRPTPRLSQLASLNRTFCSSPTVPFSFTDTSKTEGPVMWAWKRFPRTHINYKVANLSVDSMSGIGDNVNRTFTDTLLSDSIDIANVKYQFYLSANGCSDTETMIVAVKPIPKLVALNATPHTICSGEVFNNVPDCATPGFTTKWTRAAVSGILDGNNNGSAMAGSGPSYEVLKNILPNKLDTVIYMDTLIAYGCSNLQKVMVIVAPTPVLTVSHADTVCSSTPAGYIPTPSFTGASYSYTWSVVSNPDKASVTAAGKTKIDEVVSSNHLLKLVNVTYLFRDSFSINGRQCFSSDTDIRNKFVLTIKPQPVRPIITNKNPDTSSTLCQNVRFLNFTNILPDGYVDNNVTYYWQASNASIAAVGAGSRPYNCLVSLPSNNTGTPVVYSYAWVDTFKSCSIIDTYTVHINSSGERSDSVMVVRYGDNLICNHNKVKNYQWGYEDKQTLQSYVLKNKKTKKEEINQNLFIKDIESFDIDKNYYFVRVVGPNGCPQKAYYNPPGGLPRDVNFLDEEQVSVLNAYPNPATSELKVEFKSEFTSGLTVEVFDFFGKKVMEVPLDGNYTNLSVGELAAGNYLLVCLHNGYKVASTHFVKN